MILCCRVPALMERKLYERLCALSAPGRLQKADRLPSGKRAASLAAGLLLEAALRRETGKQGLSLLVREAEHGKPALPPELGLWLSLSHSGNFALCAVTRRPVGADIQKTVPVRESLLQRVCSAAEREWILKAASPAERERRFCRIWALKESWLKATGVGLAGLADARFCPVPEGLAGPEGWRFRAFSLPEGYEGAICEAEG